MEEERRICRRCGKELDIQDFYLCKRGRRRTCKECDKLKSRQQYMKRKVADGIRFRPSTKRIEEHRGLAWSIVWNGRMLSDMRRFYHNTTNEEMTELLNVSKATLGRKARELGLRKSEAFMRQKKREASLLARQANKERRMKNGL